MITYSFPGKVILVTGSSRGIGAGVLSAFARAGATCVLHYWADPDGANQKDAEALAAELRGLDSKPAVHPFPADVRDAAQVEALMAHVKGQFGGLDVLVNNAGIIKDRTLKKMTLDEWHAVIQTNLDGVFHCCKYGTEIMRDGGRVVSVASVAGLVGFHGQTNYAAAKAGVIGLTRVLAKELARRQITANAVAPGVIQTPMLGEIKPEVMAEYLKQIPVGRLGKPDDIANAVLFLASEESGYITGQVLPVTGGWV
ncbi:3-oxoacyl-[acyl-carrier-protein] reductase FabG [Gemmata obscuriglobus]|uniref:3-oxoacyl-ACP reductase FabG n=1 Tax=Gemmata obscuriglobus TaxID=114 RepID=A0A2Z3GQS2_9BACT|nr:3-oxoacyl-ACP reductase family protein [Gemmata obscuriglobus]AWM35638.1 3-oxoacyl-ACP reductase FabG [Gemmata obscuriglobus]QEG31833.1 3-oxoacyl-[acyl-carrier-protein] reductase FabG [Gemmata obscuriglobus]VTS11179.1 3-oxoacyl-acp reductase : Short-chain dehydrogenase/reductase SDR OS=Chthoniobacter flavus Ellin428 GN=CfE428DRAFT_6588 PE=3 SV=1: adh_short [Gemmata obscuriglobus UQM 2246]